MSDIVHGGIMEPCSSLWRRGNGHLVSLRTYSSCVLVRSDVELLLEGVDDMVLVERALVAAVGSENKRDFIWRRDQRDPLAKEPSRISGQHADTPLRYANWLPTSQQDTVLVQSLPLC